MRKYIANIIVYDKGGNYVDDFNEWKWASSREDALSRFRRDYEPPKYEVIITGSHE